jgi:hypothetical protein
VLGLGAVAAGAALGTMSIGWPLASAFSAKLFLRVGFRDTQLTGAAICLVAVAAFLLAPDPAPLWQPVLLLMPRRFDTRPGAAATTGPDGG